MTDETANEILDAALNSFKQMSGGDEDSFTIPSEPEGAISPTLSSLEENRRPVLKTVCESCPNSVWFSSPQEVKCYCRVMYLITWSTKEPNQMTNCDGMFLGQD